MECSRILGGFTLGHSDILRKAIGKKNIPLIEEWIGYMIYGNEELGIEGALKRGYDTTALNKLKEEWIKFGSYSFNRAHSSAYSLIGYITAWLKAYFPVHFWSALMSKNKKEGGKGGKQKNVTYTQEAKARGIKIAPPSYLTPSGNFSPIVYKTPINDQIAQRVYIGEIRIGMNSIPSVTDPVIRDLKIVNALIEKDFSILNEYEEKVKEFVSSKEVSSNEQLDMFEVISGISNEEKEFFTLKAKIEELSNAIKSLDQVTFDQYYEMITLIKKVRSLIKEKSSLGNAPLENLIKSGAFDKITSNRYDLLRQLYKRSDTSNTKGTLPESMKKADFVKMEKEMLGYTVTVESRVANMVEGDKSTFSGIIKNIESWHSKAGKKHYNLIVECSGEDIEFTLWGFKYEDLEKKGHTLMPNTKVRMRAEKGKFDSLKIDNIKVVEEQ